MGLIAGIYSKSAGPNLKRNLTAMLKCQAHRGSGGSLGILAWKNMVLGMINPHDTIFCGSKISPNPNPSDHAVVDGIVLEAELHRQRFTVEGIPIAVSTCTAIVAAAYEKWGIDFITRLEGEFACAIWDEREQRLLLVRDPNGHKPLHYYYDGKRFLFSSEVKGLLAAQVPREIDLTNLSDFLSLNCIPYPGTIFKNIFQVPPGSMLIFRNDTISIHRYWSPEFREDKKIPLNEAVHQVTESLREAVKKRLVSDTSYCFLSGGIDSSAVLSFATEISGRKIHAISVGFEEAEKNELDDARHMANHVGAELHQVIATPDSFFEMLDILVKHHDAPFTDTSAYPTFFAAKQGRALTDVILTGDGPDQCMGGSGHYVFAVKNNIFDHRRKTRQMLMSAGAKFAALFSRAPTPSTISKMQRKLYRESLSPVHAAYDLRSFFPDIVKQYICAEDLWRTHLEHNPYRHPESWFDQARHLDEINKYLYADMAFYVPDDLMIKVDRMCMAHGLETLSPFQDRKLVSFITRLPGHYKIQQAANGDIITKHILKRVCEYRFPSHTSKKTKQGFGIPLEKWLQQDNGKTLKKILLDPRTLGRGYFKPEALRTIVDVFLANRGDYFFPSAGGIVGLLTLESWHRQYID